MSKSKHTTLDKSEQDLWHYTSGKLTEQEAHAQEFAHLDDPFWNDAVEGLAEVQDKDRLLKAQLELQQQLRRKLESRKKQRRSTPMLTGMVALIVVIMLILAAYLFIFYFR
ncbi:MAG TPA: hypothetical protein VKZ76_05960 [Edaphocola sp.]|nr:hypothetical protein [Edaphocola sp.]